MFDWEALPGVVFNGGFVNDDIGVSHEEAFDDALNGGAAEIVGAGFHGEAIDADGFGIIFHDIFGDKIFAGVIGFNDGADEVLGDVFVISEELFGVFWETVAAVTKGRVVIMVANSGVKANTFDYVFGV